MLRSLIAFVLLVAIVRAAAASIELTGDSIGPVKVGMNASAIATVARVVSDRMEPDSEGGEARVVRFLMADVEVAAEVHEGKVWRFEVATPGLRTRAGLGVGTALAALLKLPKLQGQIGEGALYVSSPQLCGLSFRLSHELQTDKEFRMNWNAHGLASLPSSVKVHSLLVTGCAK
jgi:hypothetical protein